MLRAIHGVQCLFAGLTFGNPGDMSTSSHLSRMARRLRSQRSPANDGQHRSAVGGMWDEVGQLQFEFLVSEGLAPDSYLLDMGCGSLRGGIHFISHLEPSHYFGIDRTPRLLAAGETELERAGVAGK